jgi:hypothetical protein
MSRLLLVFAILFLALAPTGLQAAESPAVHSIGVLETTVLPRPSFDWPGISKETSSYALKVLDARPHKITGDQEWFERNGLELPGFDLDNLPAGIPRTFQRGPLVQALYDLDSTLLLYGKDYSGARYVVAQDPKTGSFRYAFDFADFLTVPGVKAYDLSEEPVTWALEEAGILYVANGPAPTSPPRRGAMSIWPPSGLRPARFSSIAVPGREAVNFAVVGCDRHRYKFRKEVGLIYWINKNASGMMARNPLETESGYVLPKDWAIVPALSWRGLRVRSLEKLVCFL